MTLKSNIPALRAALEGATGKGVRAAAEAIAQEARRRVPVDTGALQRSIIAAPGSSTLEWTVRSGDRLDYASYVEYGTARMAAQPYMTPAIATIKVDKLVAEELVTVIKRSATL